MNKELILHIGRHKTGTTAIQRFLAANRGWLSSQGYIYPKTGIRGYGHHEIAENLPRIKAGILTARKLNLLVSELEKEIETTPELTPILSSEAFQQRQPWITKHYLKDRNVKVTVYLRDHLSYLASAYTQKIHATTYSGTLTEFFLYYYSRVNYEKFIRRWERNFPSLLDVRIYEKQQLAQQNIILDFLEKSLGITSDIPEISKSERDANPSLNTKIVQFKRHINESGEVNQYSGKQLYKVLPQLNKHFPSEKTQVTPRVFNWVQRLNAKRDMKIAKKYFNKNSLFDYKPYSAIEEKPITKKEISLIREKLNELLPAS
ncbi:hypothetical protein [Microbulbifer sp. MCCC 1A16149]|uniref:hypothetical protein n=1 Tax=Microbulbifer sp. MCCC 1A16149 TaxID=3411322 RepID=UPI003D0BEFCA